MGYNNIFSFTFPVKNNSSIISIVRNLIQFYASISIYAKILHHYTKVRHLPFSTNA